MPAWMTPLLWPVWWNPTSSCFSSTATRRPGRRRSISRATARPMIPAPTIARSASLCTARGYEGRSMRILVTGITGYVGGALAPRLLAEGHDVRGLARGRVGPDLAALGVPVVRGDAVSGAGLDEALEDVDVAYYLIHSMETVAADAGAFGAREERSATNFAEAAVRAGVGRVVYLGGPV